MAKKPFAIRIEEATITQFRALAAVKDQDNSALFESMIQDQVTGLSKEEAVAYEALLRLWQEKAEG